MNGLHHLEAFLYFRKGLDDLLDETIGVLCGRALRKTIDIYFSYTIPKLGVSIVMVGEVEWPDRYASSPFFLAFSL